MKATVRIKEIEVERALHRLRRRGLPYKFDLNPFRGCSHGCVYCYARRSQQNLDTIDFTCEIFVKTNIAEILDGELSSPDWRGDIINIGGACDSYQHAEASFQLMRDILPIMIKHKNPVIISTKSDLILRDMDLIDELAGLAYVNIAACITSTEASISGLIEPGASAPTARLNVLKQISGTRPYGALHFMPMIPLIADHAENLETMVRWAAEAEVDYMLSGFLYLTGAARKNFFAFIEKHFPQHRSVYLNLYKKGGADESYKSTVHSRLKALRDQYGVNNSYAKFLPHQRR